MASKSKFDEGTRSTLHAQLIETLNHSVSYLDCPLTEEEMAAVWTAGVPPELIAAHRLLVDNNYVPEGACYSHRCMFAVPDQNFGVRWEAGSNSEIFFRVPLINGQYGRNAVPIVPTLKSGGNRVRVIKWPQFQQTLPAARCDEMMSWMKAAAEMTIRQDDAVKTVTETVAMLSTAGQVRRMVPELVQYLSSTMQERVMEQQRNSPFPEQWAAFDKARVERLTCELAAGHLFKGMAKRKTYRHGSFSWAQYLEPPK
jgi:hypothetical protein